MQLCLSALPKSAKCKKKSQAAWTFENGIFWIQNKVLTSLIELIRINKSVTNKYSSIQATVIIYCKFNISHFPSSYLLVDSSLLAPKNFKETITKFINQFVFKTLIRTRVTRYRESDLQVPAYQKFFMIQIVFGICFIR